MADVTVSDKDIEATEGFVFNHTMLRIKDPAKSLDFYQRILGMKLIDRRDFEEAKFSLFFLEPRGHGAGEGPRSARPGILELTHNWGTESDDSTMHSGNEEPRGFGHICISVPDIEAACARFEAEGVAFRKRLEDGRMRGLAFILDPDGYWIEIIEIKR
ncbi:MAG: lactoylglutathione lyase [Alkalilacustris sp.]